MAPRDKKIRFFFALGCALFAAAATGVISLYRDFLLPAEPARVSGKFSPTVEATLKVAALAYVEGQKKSAGAICLEKWLGQDDSYIFLAYGCGTFTESAGKISVEGDRNFHPLRLRYWGTTIVGISEPRAGAFENGMTRLFPLEARQEWFKKVSAAEFLRAGIERSRSGT